jgi:gas vesicle protein
MNAGKVFWGVAIAFGTGAVLGVLFAPDKGSITRKKLSKQSPRYLGAFTKSANEYADALEEKFDDVMETATGLTDKVTGAVDALAGHEPPKHVRRT